MRVVALDIIRFIAALMVVLYHYISRPEANAFSSLRVFTDFGYLGVPLFFIISGYVIAISASNRNALQFGISRFVRLYPALWCGVILTAFCVAIFEGRQHSTLQILANFTLLNEYLGFEDVDGVYWTLKAELKFYGCVFLLLLFGVFHKYRVWLSIWSIATILYMIIDQPFFMGWFISPHYSSYFIAGIAFYVLQKEGATTFPIVIILCSLVVSSINGYNQASGFMSNPEVNDRVVSVAIIWAFYLLFFTLCMTNIRIKERKLFFTLGTITYPLYLIHNVAGTTIIDRFKSQVSEELMVVSVIIMMILVSLAINRFIEKKMASPLKNRLILIMHQKSKTIHS